ncbi:hypothetical protein HCU64_00090 [Methylobacterium sp. C25]|uniref:hypothetical protein n=1 Tax=Methylobacterium sp. C25 TaxID=2721622 RepID=UPI001F2CA9C6|nr:hypothetical protein [Methylobacterium sp. C25]MCE4222138.1 hypothetical protein [Methylobacterium sp. C25]
MNTIGFRVSSETQPAVERLERERYVANVSLSLFEGRYWTTLQWKKDHQTACGRARSTIWMMSDGRLATDLHASWLNRADDFEGEAAGTIEEALDEIDRLLARAQSQKAAA